MQNVFCRSSLTYEWTQVTPSSAFRSTTAKDSAAPSPPRTRSPSGKVRSTTYRGISLLLSTATNAPIDGRRGARRAHRPDYRCCREALPILGSKSEAISLRARLAARPNAQLAEDGRNVMIDRPLGEHQPLGDFGIAQSFGDESEHLLLARCEAAWILPRRRTRSPRQPTSPAFAQTACDERRRRPRIQPLQFLQRAPQRLLLVRVRQCERSLVGAADLGP